MTESAGNASGHHPRNRPRRHASAAQRPGRTQILDAAVACIVDLGFYRASSNEIARRAGLSWGAIQYHFGSREALMLAVLDTLTGRFVDTLRRSDVRAGSPAERVTALYDLLAGHYGSPAYLASIQIMLDLRRGPDTTPTATEAIDAQQRRVSAEVTRLLTDTLGANAGLAHTHALFHAIRGFALSTQLARPTPTPPTPPTRPATSPPSVAAAATTGDPEAEARRIFLAVLIPAIDAPG